MENLAAFCAREVKKAAAEKKRNIHLQKDSECRKKKQSHSNEFSENCREGVVR